MKKLLKRTAFLWIITGLVLFPSVLQAETPVSVGDLEGYLRSYAKQFITKNVVKYEVTDNGGYSQVERGLFTYLVYSNLSFIYWEGTYGQIVRESAYIDFIKVDDVWVFDKFYPAAGQTVMTQGPTKPLPTVPAAPAKESLNKTLEEALPNLLYESQCKFTVNNLNLNDPTFEWRGWDFEYGAYVYAGEIQYTMKNAVYYMKPKQVWKGNCRVFMFYSIAEKTWLPGFEWVGQATQIK